MAAEGLQKQVRIVESFRSVGASLCFTSSSFEVLITITGVPNCLAFFTLRHGRLIPRLVQDTGVHTLFQITPSPTAGGLAASVGPETWLLSYGEREVQLGARRETVPSLPPTVRFCHPMSHYI